jgi:peptidoglycan/LPS O-acetylase OafA/YrhL
MVRASNVLGAEAPAAAPPARPARRFRPDVDGFRAVAILLVVGFHAGVPGFDAGFIGVDVFFVISGFLITTNLLAESEASGRVGLLDFWAKRLRRLVPALALMVFVVLGASLLTLGPLQLQRAADDARDAALYVSNVAFAHASTDYFAEDSSHSLFLHTWSLGIEEQFYVVWPVAVLAVAVVARRRRRLLRPALVALFAVTAVVSFRWCVTLTDRTPGDAFFLLPARAWEFAAAGLLAALPVPGWLLTRAGQRAAVASGLGLLAVALVRLDGNTVYPGAWALLPVLATVLVIAGGATTVSRGRQPADVNVVSRLLAARAPQWVGRVSYSWYLWHWPCILLAAAWFDTDATGVKVAAVLVALAIAAVAYHRFEQPVRLHPRLVGSLRLTFGLGAAVTLLAVAATIAVGHEADRRIDALPGEPLDQVRESSRHFTCGQERTSPTGIDYCESGDPNGATTVLLLGDSHAGHWIAGFDAAGRRDGVRVLSRWGGRCPSLAVDVSATGAPGSTRVAPGCAGFRADSLRLVGELRPDAVVLSNNSGYQDTLVDDGAIVDDSTAQAKRWGDAYEAAVTQLRAEGVAVGSIVDGPKLPSDPLECVGDHRSVSACSLSKVEAFSRTVHYSAAERRRAERLGVPRLDITDVLCPDDCPVVVDGRYVYTDRAHLYRRFVVAQAPAVSEFLHRLLATGP